MRSGLKRAAKRERRAKGAARSDVHGAEETLTPVRARVAQPLRRVCTLAYK
jgi:hypothetical protein